MFRLIVAFTFLATLLIVAPIRSQEEAESKIELSKKTFGINVGTGLFQHVKLNLVNFNQEVLATSENIVPINFKANFNYYFTPNLAIRFSSGYGFYQQKMNSEIDFDKIHTKESIEKHEANFSVTGFPAEAVLVFQAPLDARALIFFHFGFGIGYYAYNYEAEGTLAGFDSRTNQQTLKEKYINPKITLSGGAQFFILGFDVNIAPGIVAALEFSKAGWSMMKLKRDVVAQEIEAEKVSYEIKYGYEQEDYTVRNGFDDLAVSMGIFWQL